ncbi:MAG TPA: DUF892 family protein [Solirubrobacteraceae bacterium]|jgi:ferritin-like metal-binding protein YciE
MAPSSAAEQVDKYLTDMHAIELQALEQMRLAPRVLEEQSLAQLFAQHAAETETHERLVGDQLSARGVRPSRAKDAAGRVGGWGMILFARLNPDSTGKLVAHAYSYEHMEFAAYELLGRFAERSGAADVAQMARTISAGEQQMAERLHAHWERAAEASLAENDDSDLAGAVSSYLRDARSLEAQSLQLLSGAASVVEVSELVEVLHAHESETREHAWALDERLAELGSGPARAQDGLLRFGGLALPAFFGAQADTAMKIAGFAFAFEALERAGYGLLTLVAKRAGDESTARLAQRIAVEELQAGERLAGTWDAVVDAYLSKVLER